MSLFRCIVLAGHQGAGRGEERVVFVRAYDSLHALSRAKAFPGVKKGRRFHAGSSVISVEKVGGVQEG